jgi:uncharacterized membrane protein YozB (DUF420 family)
MTATLAAGMIGWSLASFGRGFSKGRRVLTAENVILTLKIAVIGVTLIFFGSLVALARGNYRLHGRINLAFCVLTLAALLGLEVVARLVEPDLFKEHFTRTQSWKALYVHLCFAVPSALALPLMLYTGLRGVRSLHLGLAWVFVVLWTGTFVTGVFFLPHTAGP